jgi:flagellar motor switch protein FliN/FliY
MTTYLDCWATVAAALFSQALAGEPEFNESLPKPLGSQTFGFALTISGDLVGRFSVVLEQSILDTPFLGEGADQRAGWSELLRETGEAAIGELLAKSGLKCRVEAQEEITGTSSITRAFQLKSSAGAWMIQVRDETREKQVAAAPPKAAAAPRTAPDAQMPVREPGGGAEINSGISPGIELLLDVELEATLRFGCRELPLGEVLGLGPGDVVELDRHVSDPVDLIVGDKIVARGEVVLVNGNFGLRVTEVAEPRKRLESIRCLF